MPSYLLLLFSIVAYLLASGLMVSAVRHGPQNSIQAQQLNWAYAAALLAALAHFLYGLESGNLGLPLNFSLSAMSTLISLILVAIFLLGSLLMPIKRLGLLIFPFTAASLAFSSWWDSEANYVANHGLAFNTHILVSIFAYSLLAIAAIQALLFFYQERQIKNRSQSAILLALPPLETMEQLLFKLVAIGFVLLSATLLSGAIFSQQIFGQAFVFKHHTILAILGWLVFACLLYKRVHSGLRGSQAVIWTISGFALIQLGYFGTKIISESLNIQ